MKIAFILPALVNKGPIIVAKNIIDHLINCVEIIDVYYFDDQSNPVEINFKCMTYKISFFSKIDFNRYDIIHSHMLRPDLYIWLNRKRIKNTIFISTLHQYIFDNLKSSYNIIVANIFERVWLAILKKQDIVVTLTKNMMKFYSQKTNLNLKYIYNGRDLENGNDEISRSDLLHINNLKLKYKLIGNHSLLTERKGIDQIIKSLVYLQDYAFIVIGDGKEMENLINLSNKMNVADRCYFVGYKNNAVDYLHLFDIYVMPSRSEGFGLSLIEAGIKKLPIVCSSIPAFKELFNDNEVVFFDIEDINSLSNAVRFAYQNKELFASNVFNKIMNKYTAKVMADNYYQLYLSMVKNK